jgi:hypothetical protein
MNSIRIKIKIIFILFLLSFYKIIVPMEEEVHNTCNLKPYYTVLNEIKDVTDKLNFFLYGKQKSENVDDCFEKYSLLSQIESYDGVADDQDSHIKSKVGVLIEPLKNNNTMGKLFNTSEFCKQFFDKVAEQFFCKGRKFFAVNENEAQGEYCKRVTEKIKFFIAVIDELNNGEDKMTDDVCSKVKRYLRNMYTGMDRKVSWNIFSLKFVFTILEEKDPETGEKDCSGLSFYCDGFKRMIDECLLEDKQGKNNEFFDSSENFDYSEKNSESKFAILNRYKGIIAFNTLMGLLFLDDHFNNAGVVDYCSNSPIITFLRNNKYSPITWLADKISRVEIKNQFFNTVINAAKEHKTVFFLGVVGACNLAYYFIREKKKKMSYVCRD